VRPDCLRSPAQETVSRTGNPGLLACLTRTHVKLRFIPNELPQREKEIIHVVGEQPQKTGIKLNPKLISFVVLSIFIGSILQGITPNHPPIEEMPTLAITITVIWLFLSSCFFFTFRFFGGKGGFGDTISISLQLLASIYVIASLITLIITALFLANDGNFGISYLVYLTAQILLLIIYLPLGLKELHFPSTKVQGKFVLATVVSITLFLFIVYNFFAATMFLPSYR
jgi:hypothetical protein